MQSSVYPLERVLPHGEGMRLIDEIISFDSEAKELVSAFTARKEWPMNVTAIEFMAQTAAALAGHADIESGYDGPPKPGFLLGTRKMELAVARFEVGRRYFVRAKNVFTDGMAASFECRVESESGEVLASATLNAVRPDELDENML